MRCDQGKSVWNRPYDIFNLLFDLRAHLERYILLKTPPKSDQWFISYEQLKDAQNNRKQEIFRPFSGHISQSMLAAPDFRLIQLDCNIIYCNPVKQYWYNYALSYYHLSNLLFFCIITKIFTLNISMGREQLKVCFNVVTTQVCIKWHTYLNVKNNLSWTCVFQNVELAFAFG